LKSPQAQSKSLSSAQVENQLKNLSAGARIRFEGMIPEVRQSLAKI